MSTDYYAFVPSSAGVDRVDWEAAAAALGFPLTFGPDFHLPRAKGFCRIELAGESTGCEIDFNLDDREELTSLCPLLQALPKTEFDIISFRIPLGMGPPADTCALALGAALVGRYRAIFFDPQCNKLYQDAADLSRIAQASQPGQSNRHSERSRTSASASVRLASPQRRSDS